ncbi:MAG: hypothetical protein CMM46_03360 [Rhodospirillaceae bacterium]|nr:hypothetical protein [Rhodospirillaceae bacterium]|tara:strand:- start:5226 stop:5522 length:297 start_codon:yes stop_codon:yes gene_type:complete
MSETVFTMVKDMAITVPDFFRLLPRALDERNHTITGYTVSVGTADKGVVIAIEPVVPRRIALIVVERCTVTLTFTGMAEEERDAFLFRFDRAYQRGGG